jgi:lipoprotein-anchoring transpeptidase ErfK/SrfK
VLFASFSRNHEYIFRADIWFFRGKAIKKAPVSPMTVFVTAILDIPCFMKKHHFFHSKLFFFCTIVLASLASIAHSGPYTKTPVQLTFVLKEHAATVKPFLPGGDSDAVRATSYGALGNEDIPSLNQDRYAYRPVTTFVRGRRVAGGDDMSRPEYKIFVYTAPRFLLLYRGKKSLAVYPVAVGKDNVWLDNNNIGAPIKLAGRTYTVKKGDNLWSISRRFGMDMWKIASFNALSVEEPLHPGQGIRIPSRHIDITPYGTFTITNKVQNPVFKRGGRTIQPFHQDRSNLLGSRWIGLSNSSYGIHGTNAPELIGTYSTQGCIRMLNKDVEQLFNLVQVGVEVVIQRTPTDKQRFSSWFNHIKRGLYD